ncbi:hypothetical protein BHE90_016570 [Fusarium euwallaceae]|uniref:BTB domain-containing protein n=2 Tax=Fusarium solani species complex TaxID=232080 RepID=A0A3M2RMV1_9HYPO|nr:hypothetical protein CDV36_013914 [Fusarium kuroshium]RTE69051.1 hypothetical protein BHE90_016570 [Fusarium euwallaceae]
MEAGSSGSSSSDRVQNMVTIVFSGHKKILLPEKIIKKHPKLASQFVTTQDGKELDFDGYLEPVVHVVVMFLFTGTYQDLHDLDENELEEYEEAEAMLNRVLQTYMLATEYGLDMLAKLAVHGFDVMSMGMSLPRILNVVCGSGITFHNQHIEMMNALIQKARRIGWEVELDQGLGAYQSAFKNDGTVFGVLFSQILEQRTRIKELMSENNSLKGLLDLEME